MLSLRDFPIRGACMIREKCLTRGKWLPHGKWMMHGIWLTGGVRLKGVAAFVVSFYQSQLSGYVGFCVVGFLGMSWILFVLLVEHGRADFFSFTLLTDDVNQIRTR
jgi:hypothetical protein